MTTSTPSSAGESMELAIAKIDDPATTNDELAEIIGKIEFAVEAAKDIEARAKQALTRRIEASGGKAVEIGRFLWHLKHPKSVKCRNVYATILALMEATGADLESFCRDYLSSNAVKYGAARQALNDEARFDELFETTVDTTVERKLTKTDKNFLEAMPSRHKR